MKKSFLISFLLVAAPFFADKAPVNPMLEGPQQPGVEAPWLTGPLLAPAGITVPAGHYNIEPYLSAIAQTGMYGHDWKAKKTPTLWNNLFQPVIQVGINSYMDFQIAPTLYYKRTKGASNWGAGDLPLALDFQLYKHGTEITEWLTGVLLTVAEFIPIGKYQNLNPAKKGTDAVGAGSWQTGLALVWGNMFYLGGNRFLTARFFAQYLIPAPVRVKNLNTYGGAKGTRGTAYPPQIFQFDIGTELTLNKNWAFAMDILSVWNGKTRFKGKTTAPNTAPASFQFSLAPAIEYNWNANLGIIFGPWLTLAGRNSPQFVGGVFALNYYN